MHKTLNVLEFLGAELPVNALAEHSAIVFDDDSEPFLHHSATTEEVKELCNDIKVLGIRELKILLKWHKALKAYKRELEQGVAPRGDRLEIDNKPSLEDISDSEKLEKQIEELRRREESRMKRLKRKKKQLRIKSANISAMGGIEQDADFDSNLFSFAMIHTLKDLDQVQEANSSATIVPHDEDSESGSQDADEESISNDERYDMLEEELQGMYESYKERRQIVDRKRRQKAKELGLPVSDEENSVELNDEPEAEAEGEEAVVMPQLTSALQVDFEDPLEVAKQKWFERDLLRDLEQSGDLKAPDPAPTVSTSLDSDDEEQELPASSATIGKRRKRKKDDGEEKEAFNFEEVPAEDFGTWSDDSDAVAEGLALGTAMLRKKRREQIINDAYNRYAFHDNPADLPDWFVEDEEAHCRPQLPVTKAEVDEQKLRLQELNAKPIKKILEAKGRKKMRAMKKWEILKNQAKSITDNPDMAMKEKMKKIEKLYARNKKKKVDKTYVVSQKRGGVHASSGAKKRGSFLVRVDPRMKKDKRGMKAAERRKKRVKH
jgi:AdoMet-dependent rRNA methyltransferase SPB1